MSAICFGFFAVTIRMQMENQLHKIDLFHADFIIFIVFQKKRTCAVNFHILFVILPCHSEFCYSIHAALRLEEFLIWHNPRQFFAAWVFVEYKL